jgi:hypothetical protein
VKIGRLGFLKIAAPGVIATAATKATAEEEEVRS